MKRTKTPEPMRVFLTYGRGRNHARKGGRALVNGAKACLLDRDAAQLEAIKERYGLAGSILASGTDDQRLDLSSEMVATLAIDHGAPLPKSSATPEAPASEAVEPAQAAKPTNPSAARARKLADLYGEKAALLEALGPVEAAIDDLLVSPTGG